MTPAWVFPKVGVSFASGPYEYEINKQEKFAAKDTFSQTLLTTGAEPGDAIISMDNLAVTKVSQLYTLLNRVAIGAKFTWRLRRVTVSGNVSEWCIQASPQGRLMIPLGPGVKN